MRKLFSFLAAAVIAVSAVTAVYAADRDLGVYRAEVSFAAAATIFGFELRQMASTSNKPNADYTLDTSTGIINWENAFGPVLAGNEDSSIPDVQKGFIGSRTYAVISSQTVIAPDVSVQLYTDNTNGTAYKFAGSMTPANVGPLAAQKGPNAVDAKALPLVFQIVVDSTSVDNVKILNDIGVAMTTSTAMTETTYGRYFTVDKKDATFADKSSAYSTIATDQGIKTGTRESNDFGNGDFEEYWYGYPKAGNISYLFFSSSFFAAKNAHKYGTDTLTVRIIGE
jgi:hypothetical protein